MENHSFDMPDTNPLPDAHTKTQIGLPLIALGLDFVPALLSVSGLLGMRLPSFAVLCMTLSPIAGLIVGIISLIRGKDRIGILGKVIAIIAIALPLLVIGFIVIFFIGAMTGVISLM